MVSLNDLMKKQDRQCTYNVNIEGLSCNHCCSGKAKIITYHERVFVALGNQCVMRMSRTVICGLLGSTIFFHINLLKPNDIYIYIYIYVVPQR